MANDPLEVVTVRLRAGDKQALNSFHPDLKYNRVIRKLVSQYVDNLRKKENAALEQIKGDL